MAATALDGLEPGMAASQQPVVEENVLRDIWKRLSDIDDDLSGQSGPLSSEERDRLTLEKENLAEQVKAAGSGGHLRAMKSPQEQARRRVRGAIRRALDAIKKQHETLWQHLDASLIDREGANPCYRPATPVTWRVNV